MVTKEEVNKVVARRAHGKFPERDGAENLTIDPILLEKLREDEKTRVK